MCGIFVAYHKFGFNSDQIFSDECNSNNLKSKNYINILLLNAQLLKHRGSFDNHITISNKLLFYHNRLAINDLSKSGQQPIVNDLITIVVNGEIYNYNELYELIIKELPSYRFKSKSDSEILIPLYLKYGSSFIRYIRGMFSFVLYDMKKKIFIVARDPYGITSLYYAIDENRILISSELKALYKLSKNIKIFPPGQIYINNHFYNYNKQNWLIEGNATKLPNYELDYNELKNKLIESVYSHIKLTDQPLGFLLSGGVDSSLVVSIASYLKKKKLINNIIKTFTIGLDGGSDIKYAEEVAKMLKTEHTTYTFTFDEVLENLKKIIYYIETYDITTVRASICNYLLIKKIKENTDIKVLLSGEGSDEIFGGYLYFHKCPSHREMQLELQDKLLHLHKYDCLRAHKSGMANTIEVRVPFLDTDFVDYIMNINPKYKMINEDQPIEKYILRKAFENKECIGSETKSNWEFLPHNVLFRQKEQFSDGISNSENNLIHKLKEYADKQISDSEFTNKDILYPINTPLNKEHMLYRKIFEENFGNNLNTILTVDHNIESVACSTKRGLSWLNLKTNSKYNDPSGKIDELI